MTNPSLRRPVHIMETDQAGQAPGHSWDVYFTSTDYTNLQFAALTMTALTALGTALLAAQASAGRTTYGPAKYSWYVQGGGWRVDTEILAR